MSRHFRATTRTHAVPHRTPRARAVQGARGERLLGDLNSEQRKAATTTDGPLLIIAGAGSGKTRTLTHRIAYLIHAIGVPPDEILAMTFTNKAAREMRERVGMLLQRRRLLPWMGTFHSFCARVLRRESRTLSLPPTFTIYDEEDARSLMKSVITDAGFSPKTVSPAAVLATIGKWKDELQALIDVREAAHEEWEERVAGLWEVYEARLRELAAVDFDGLLYHTVMLMQSHAALRARLETQYRYLSVDEYQDTNQSQAELLKLLAGQTQNICAVGDDAQAIYGWRGARIENIRSFPKQFPGCITVTLEENYRSTQAILKVANALMRESTEAYPKTLWTKNGPGTHPRLLVARDADTEGRLILREFQRLFSEGRFGPQDAAILYRTNAQSRALEESCLRLGIPYEIVGGLTFYERREVKDIIAYLRLIQNPADELAFRRIANVPTRGVGERTVEYCLAASRRSHGSPLDADIVQTLPDARRDGLEGLARLLTDLREEASRVRPVTVLDLVLKRTDFRAWLQSEEIRTRGAPDPAESRYENVLELRTVAERHTTLTAFLEELALMSEAEKTTTHEHRNRAKLMTIHAAKGLEFPIVAVAGLEDGLLPHQQALDTTAGLEEERRLCYVAITRAREHLFLTYARTRSLYGSLVETAPSRFLGDLPGDDHDEPVGEDFTDITESDEPTIHVELPADARGTPRDNPASPHPRGAKPRTGAMPSTDVPVAPGARVDERVPAFSRGERVRHVHFGEGQIEAVDGGIITVRFPEGVKQLDTALAPLMKLR